MIFGYFELFVLIFLIVFNLSLPKLPTTKPVHYVIIILLFGLILPAIGIKIEIEVLISKGIPRDGMYFLWTMFKFPIYWGMGVFEIVWLALKNKKRIKHQFYSSDND